MKPDATVAIVNELLDQFGPHLQIAARRHSTRARPWIQINHGRWRQVAWIRVTNREQIDFPGRGLPPGHNGHIHIDIGLRDGTGLELTVQNRPEAAALNWEQISTYRTRLRCIVILKAMTPPPMIR